MAFPPKSPAASPAGLKPGQDATQGKMPAQPFSKKKITGKVMGRKMSKGRGR